MNQMPNQPNIWVQQPPQMPQPSTFTPNWNQPVIPPSLQQQPQNPNAVGMNWRFVNSPDEVLPAEIPMNGAIGVFVASDLSAVYLKQWNRQGGIDTVVYQVQKPELPVDITKQRETSPEFQQIMVRMDEMMDLLDTMRQPQPSSNTSAKKTSQKKEVETND